MNVVIDKSSCGGIVCFNGSWWLRVVESLEEVSDRERDSCIVVHTSHLSFCCGGDYTAKCLAFYKDCPIKLGMFGDVGLV